jgi:hypothetical protein
MHKILNAPIFGGFGVLYKGVGEELVSTFQRHFFVTILITAFLEEA